MSIQNEFKYVCYKKKKKEEKQTIEWLFSRYEKQTENLIGSNFYHFTSEAISKIISLKKPVKIARLVMLGLGSFQNNSRSITQLSFGIKIANHLDFEGKIEAYDPVFTFLDCQLLKKLDINLNLHNLPSVLYNAEQPVVFYMPHCPISLYESLFKENWSPRKLCNIFLIGNCLKTYNLTMEFSKKEKYPFVFKACMIFESILFPKTFEQLEIFNDLAFQWCEKNIVEKHFDLNNDYEAITC
ncbi:hypothetical protein PORY_002680 [Pneumocystis oryctolagi]|uniref:Uncharacterized protein n=1 Tax=Pneumocystis oryctolagi TaxID=42067 RepID=A0ACB7C8T2_9ASCO|nr:hypothetical protein PORY_002680 [Pneumocystis oryctolagi]